MFRALFEKLKVFFVGKKSNNHLMIMDLTHQNLIFQINEAEGRAISSEEHFTKYEGPEDIATPREFIEIPNGGRNLLDRFNFEHISLNSNSKNSDSNLDLAEHAFRMDFESLKTSQNTASVSPHRPLNSQSIANLEQSFLSASLERKSR